MRFLTFFILLGSFQTFVPSSLAAPSTYDLMKVSQNSHVELSPNGQYLAFASTVTDQICTDQYGRTSNKPVEKCNKFRIRYRASYGLNIYDLETRKIIKHAPMPKDIIIGWFHWASDSQLLAAIQSRTTLGATARKISVGSSQVISISIEDRAAVVLFEDQKRVQRVNRRLSSITDILRDDPDHVLMPAVKGGALNLWKVNVITGSAKLVAQGKRGTYYWFTDKLGKPVLRFDLNNSGTRVYVYSYSDELREWEKIRTVNIKKDSDDELAFWPIAMTNTPNQLYVLTDEEDDARRAIKIYDIKEKRYLKTVFEHPEMDVRGAFVELHTGIYAGAYYWEDRLDYTFVNPVMQSHYGALNKFFANAENVAFIGSTVHGKKILVEVSGPDNPGEFYYYDVDAKKIDFLFSRRGNLPRRELGLMEVIRVPVRDGHIITGYLSHPPSGKNVDAPLIVMPHGGPETRDHYNYNREVQFLVTRGYQVLQVNFRGSSGYGRSFAEAGYGEWGGVMQNDITDVVKHLHKNGKAPADKTCIVGASYGGYAALYGAVSTPDLYKCVVSVAGVSDLFLILKQTVRDEGRHSDAYDYWKESIGHPRKDRVKLRARSPVNLADKVTAPVLLVHGEFDGIVYVEQSKRMYGALKRANKEVEFIELKHEGHYGWSLENEIIYHEALEKFLADNLR